MTLNIGPRQMTSDVCTHVARLLPKRAGDDPAYWSVTWIEKRQLTYNQAITAMTLAEMVAAHAGNLAEDGAWKVHIDQWAAELGMTGPMVIALAIKPPPQADHNGNGPGHGHGHAKHLEMDKTWADVARDTRAALALLGHPIDPLCLPDEIGACGGTFSQHAAAHLATIVAIADHQIKHLGPGYRGMVNDVYNETIREMKTWHSCQG